MHESSGTRKTTGTPGPQSVKKEKERTFIEQARRKQILEVARELFARNGFSKTSIEEIAAGAGVSRGVIFYHFNGKKELGKETVIQGLRNYGDYVQARVAKKRTARSRLLEFVDACLDYTSEYRNDYLMYVDTVGCFGDTTDKYNMLVWVNQRTRNLLIELIEEGQASGNIAKISASDLADVIHAIVDGLMELSAIEPGKINTKGCKSIVRKMLLNAIKP